ncbi:hypothetical protein TNCV_2923771 [Trichonephila clavipes]|nr:hypothetical protein TNCV_2923771 [Trichonephila clavipes]
MPEVDRCLAVTPKKKQTGFTIQYLLPQSQERKGENGVGLQTFFVRHAIAIKIDMNSINLKYEAVSVPQGSVRLVKKAQERKSSACYLLITKGVTSSRPVPLKARRVGNRYTLILSRAQTSSCWSGEVVKRGQHKYCPRHLSMAQN